MKASDFHSPRQKIVIGAWKAYLNNDMAVNLAKRIRLGPGPRSFPFEIVVCPSFISLASVDQILRGSLIGLGAQNVHWEDNGAYTSQITAQMLVGVGCTYVILGHSELRAYGERDETVNSRAKTALCFGLKPVICVGESLEQQLAGDARVHVARQVESVLDGVTPEHLVSVMIAYEPIWAITSNANPDAQPATTEQAAEMHKHIRDTIAREFGQGLANQVKILYGGSVSADNEDKAKHAESLIVEENIDGFLVGSASIKPDSFLKIIMVIDRALSNHKSCHAV